MNKSKLAVLCFLASAFSACGQKNKGGSAIKTTVDSVSYGIGVSIGENFKKEGLTDMNIDVMARGISEAMKGEKTELSMEQIKSVIDSYMGEKQKVKDAEAQAKGAANLEKGKKFLEENGKRQGVVTLPSGLEYEIIKEGNGPKPKADDMVTTHYHGTLIDGKVFDSSVERGQPAQFALNQVIPAWTEALQLMPVGSKWKLFVPANLAYGEHGAGGVIGPNETLIFEVELLSIDKK
ncbi:MAG: FKBP-type peptidyl-prolyl cis-trans isomerase [Bacteroidetes bacterium]|jgi:FKBP-type peptidyl-prolyl cis-trans isomerase FklB|nr:FKBP-type peptidyl-prolyl cis-trans isomerase [Bacteroidota bacterium]